MNIKFPIYLYLFWLLFFLTQACALPNIYKKDSFSPRKLEILLTANDYPAALSYIDKSSGASSEKDARKQQILKLIEQYEATITAEVKDQLAGNDIASAMAITEGALRKIPASKRLKRLKTTLVKRRQDSNEDTQRNLQLSQANFLLEQVELFGEKARISKPSLNTKWQIAKMEHALAALHANLVKCGKKAIASANFDIADTCLQMAKKINDSEEVYQLIAAIHHKLTPPDETLTARNYKKIAPGFSNKGNLPTIKEIQNDINNGHLAIAAKKIRIIQANSASKQALAGLVADLERQKETTSAELLQRGLTLYTTGKISQARQAWLEILVYDANNAQAVSHIKRANKVLSRLCELQKSQEEQNSPPGR